MPDQMTKKMNDLSDKQDIYTRILELVLIYTRARTSQPWWRRIFERSLHLEVELVHNLTVSICKPEFVEHDIWFLNAQARYYVEHGKNVCRLYAQQVELIGQLFDLVPKHLRNKLDWKGPFGSHTEG